ncbi:hypothetical protein DPMN_019018 [Dreissena polymorpha]|uniref:Uncharacterized protein n=1 Tax=Dreissena polymorpha TaxID=45954 RepID=A0A9D4NJW9_DREPO|nr:hypothetical protein DPMN_019018 [Dreissena polymorpha]
MHILKKRREMEKTAMETPTASVFETSTVSSLETASHGAISRVTPTVSNFQSPTFSAFHGPTQLQSPTLLTSLFQTNMVTPDRIPVRISGRLKVSGRLM